MLLHRRRLGDLTSDYSAYYVKLILIKGSTPLCLKGSLRKVSSKKDPVSDCATRVDRSLVRFDVSKVGRSVGLGESAKNCGGPVISQNSTFPFYSLCRIFRMHYNTCHFVEMLLR